MMELYVLLALFSIAGCANSLPPSNEDCAFGSYPPKDRPTIPEYVIHLDLPPMKRWEEVGRKEGEKIREMASTLRNLLLGLGGFAKSIIYFVDNNMGKWADTFPYPFGEELKGLANATQLPLGEIVLSNIFYEFFTVCTSIIAHDDERNLYHARNMDFGLFMGWDTKNDTWLMTEVLRRSVIKLTWQMNGETVFQSAGFAGQVGIFTGLKPGILSLTVNERFNIDGGFLGLFKWILGYRKSNWLSFITRQTMEKADSYEEARNWLASKELLAPVYFILGGNVSTQGCIITRGRLNTVDIWDIGTRNSTFYLLETNYDHWKSPPWIDDRRTTGMKCMESLSVENVGFRGLFGVLSSKPVLNKLTTFTALMQVSSGTMKVFVQDCPDPCSPW